MNKRIFICLSPLLALLLTSFTPKAIDPNYQLFYVTSSIYGPYSRDDGEVIISYQMEYTSTNNLSVREGFEYHADGRKLYQNTNSYHAMRSFRTVNRSLVFDTSFFSQSSYLTIVFFIESDTTRYYEKEFYVVERKSFEIDIEDYPYTYNTPYTCFSVTSNDSYNEQYDFRNVEHTFPGTSYYELDVSKLSFNYSFQKSFTCKNAYLRFKDPKNYFKGIGVYDRTNQYKRFLLDYHQNGSTIIFSPSPLLYQEGTMMVSYYQLLDNSLKETNHIFLPLKQRENLKGMTFELVVEEAGVNKTTLYSKTVLNTYRNLFGDCGYSDYCVTGEQHD